jgi:hypothetical protein
LSRGTEFHREIQRDFLQTADGERRTAERSCRTTGGQTGRIDIHIEVDDALHSVIEVKHSDWDRMASHRVQPNIRRYVRQVWRYIEAVAEEGKDISPAIIFARAPSDPVLKRRIESAFEDECITVAWADEGSSDGGTSPADT